MRIIRGRRKNENCNSCNTEIKATGYAIYFGENHSEIDEVKSLFLCEDCFEKFTEEALETIKRQGEKMRLQQDVLDSTGCEIKVESNKVMNKTIGELLNAKKLYDNITHPSHYMMGSKETIEIIKEVTDKEFQSYCVGNVIKYISRYRYKNGVEDLKKAQQYIQFMIDDLERENKSKEGEK